MVGVRVATEALVLSTGRERFIIVGTAACYCRDQEQDRHHGQAGADRLLDIGFLDRQE